MRFLLAVSHCVAGDTYKRGQVEWALWRAFTFTRAHGDGPPPVFRTRIKRLLDVDRTYQRAENCEPPPCEFAFIGHAVGGTGVDTDYTACDVFCLGLALDLLDVGFKQSEVVFVMRYLRADLERWFPKLLARPSLIDRQNNLAKHHPNLPTYQPKRRGALLADARVFLTLNRIELTELLPGANKGAPLFQAPAYREGVEDLLAHLSDLMPHHRRSVVVLEITGIAQAVTAFLEVAPNRPRGRPALKQR